MKITARFATAVLSAGLFVLPAVTFAQGPGPGYNQGPGGYNQGPGYDRGPGGRGGWDAPPSDFTRDLQRNAFHDGLEGARRDLENHRRPSVNNRDEYRNYRGPERRAYRMAFERGYRAFWDHSRMGGPGGPR
jgi:hypothetical protein